MQLRRGLPACLAAARNRRANLKRARVQLATLRHDDIHSRLSSP